MFPKLAVHCSAAYLASVNNAGCTAPLDECTLQAVTLFNSLVGPASTVSEESLLHSGFRQKDLSKRIDDYRFDQHFLTSTPSNPARLLSVSSCHASSWLAVIPPQGLNLHLEPDEFQVALKWWLGMDTSSQLWCPYCPDHQLEPLGHHALTCKGSGDVVLHHDSLRDVFAQICHRA